MDVIVVVVVVVVDVVVVAVDVVVASFFAVADWLRNDCSLRLFIRVSKSALPSITKLLTQSPLLSSSISSSTTTTLNFGGMKHELCYEYGGEIGFISTLIHESSIPFIHQRIKIFTTLVSSQDHLPILMKLLAKQQLVMNYFTIDMEHGNKKSRILVWMY